MQDATKLRAVCFREWRNCRNRNGQFLRDRFSELNIPKSVLAFVIKKWKVDGDGRNVLRPGRPTKLRDRDRRVMLKEIQKNGTKPMPHIHQKLNKHPELLF
ncbi:hypothetical protein TNCV_741601 [Trichonephila clavipes]|nr:hypothetical protein TNCV_741601 [Trichonephila clavipes]